MNIYWKTLPLDRGEGYVVKIRSIVKTKTRRALIKKRISLAVFSLMVMLSLSIASAHTLTVKAVPNPQHPEWPLPSAVYNPMGDYCFFYTGSMVCSGMNNLTLPYTMVIFKDAIKVRFHALFGVVDGKPDIQFIGDRGRSCPDIDNTKNVTFLIMPTREDIPKHWYRLSCILQK